MSDWMAATFIGLSVGVIGTGAGGALCAFMRRPKGRTFGAVLGLAGGMMLSVTAFDLVPEALRIGGTTLSVLGLSTGAFVLGLADQVLPHIHLFSGDKESSRFKRTAFLVGLGISMHNFPEGLAIGASYGSSYEFGLSIAALILLQNIPEGAAMGAPLALCGTRPSTVVLATALAGVPMGVGALAGQLLGTVSEAILALSLGFAAGAMLFIASDELIPGAQEAGEGHAGTYGVVLGVIIGIMASRLLPGS